MCDLVHVFKVLNLLDKKGVCSLLKDDVQQVTWRVFLFLSSITVVDSLSYLSTTPCSHSFITYSHGNWWTWLTYTWITSLSSVVLSWSWITSFSPYVIVGIPIVWKLHWYEVVNECLEFPTWSFCMTCFNLTGGQRSRSSHFLTKCWPWCPSALLNATHNASSYQPLNLHAGFGTKAHYQAFFWVLIAFTPTLIYKFSILALAFSINNKQKKH